MHGIVNLCVVILSNPNLYESTGYHVPLEFQPASTLCLDVIMECVESTSDLALMPQSWVKKTHTQTFFAHVQLPQKARPCKDHSCHEAALVRWVPHPRAHFIQVHVHCIHGCGKVLPLPPLEGNNMEQASNTEFSLDAVSCFFEPCRIFCSLCRSCFVIQVDGLF